jgi:Tfp pilus assembly protein PilP
MIAALQTNLLMLLLALLECNTKSEQLDDFNQKKRSKAKKNLKDLYSS